MMKSLFYLIIGVAVLFVFQSKKCSSSSSSSKNVETQFPPQSGGPTTTIPIKLFDPDYLNSQDYNTLVELCGFGNSINQTILVEVLYTNSSLNEVVFSSSIYTQQDLSMTPGGWSLNHAIPSNGNYWIRVTITYDNCDDCCGQELLSNQGLAGEGCLPTPQTNNLEQGKPQFILESDLNYWGNEQFVPIYPEEASCICQC